jgi:hypothetical protein
MIDFKEGRIFGKGKASVQDIEKWVQKIVQSKSVVQRITLRKVILSGSTKEPGNEIVHALFPIFLSQPLRHIILQGIDLSDDGIQLLAKALQNGKQCSVLKSLTLLDISENSRITDNAADALASIATKVETLQSFQIGNNVEITTKGAKKIFAALVVDGATGHIKKMTCNGGNISPTLVDQITGRARTYGRMSAIEARQTKIENNLKQINAVQSSQNSHKQGGNKPQNKISSMAIDEITEYSKKQNEQLASKMAATSNLMPLMNRAVELAREFKDGDFNNSAKQQFNDTIKEQIQQQAVTFLTQTKEEAKQAAEHRIEKIDKSMDELNEEKSRRRALIEELEKRLKNKPNEKLKQQLEKLKQEQERIIAMLDTNLARLSEKKKIESSPALSAFYHQMQIYLNDEFFFLKLKGTGRVDTKESTDKTKSKISTVAGGVKKVGQGAQYLSAFFGPLGAVTYGAGLLTELGASAVDLTSQGTFAAKKLLAGVKDKRAAKVIAQMCARGESSEILAGKLAIIYQDQIEQLTTRHTTKKDQGKLKNLIKKGKSLLKKMNFAEYKDLLGGAETLAEFAADFCIQFLREGKVILSGKLPVTQQLLNCILMMPVDQDKKSIEKKGKGDWKKSHVFVKPAIRVKEDGVYKRYRQLGDRCNDPEHYGYRMGTQAELKNVAWEEVGADVDKKQKVDQTVTKTKKKEPLFPSLTKGKNPPEIKNDKDGGSVIQPTKSSAWEERFQELEKRFSDYDLGIQKQIAALEENNSKKDEKILDLEKRLSNAEDRINRLETAMTNEDEEISVLKNRVKQLEMQSVPSLSTKGTQTKVSNNQHGTFSGKPSGKKVLKLPKIDMSSNIKSS